MRENTFSCVWAAAVRPHPTRPDPTLQNKGDGSTFPPTTLLTSLVGTRKTIFLERENGGSKAPKNRGATAPGQSGVRLLD